MAYCDHKCTGTCPDCIETIIELRNKVRRLEREVENLTTEYTKLEQTYLSLFKQKYNLTQEKDK